MKRVVMVAVVAVEVDLLETGEGNVAVTSAEGRMVVCWGRSRAASQLFTAHEPWLSGRVAQSP